MMRNTIKIAASVSALALSLSACSQSAEKPASAASLTADNCTSVAADALGATSASGAWVAATDDLPAYCEVTATLSPAEGSAIGVVYRLPESWNGKVLGLGGGGWAGNLTLQAASEGLSKGYATLQTDGGHASTDVWDNSWAANPEAAKDFSWRAIHEMTKSGKKLVADRYGREPDRAYFHGCSTGGRMALMEAQRHPDDYDAIIAGAPVYTLQVQTSAVLRNNTFARNNGGFTAEDLKLVQSSVIAACDEADGLKDGLINDPRQCSWDPKEIECTGAKTASCLAPSQVASLRVIYDGVRAPDGQWAMFPMSRGGEAGWSAFVGTDGTGKDVTGGGGLMMLANIILNGKAPNFATFSADKDVSAIRGSAFAEMYEAKDPDLSPFFSKGGKLLLWHGENDPGPSPVGSNDYAKAVLSTATGAADSFRYFLMPGVEHCRGGPGAEQVSLLDALDTWVTTDKAPERLIATKADKSITRPHCAWPNVAQFSGTGDANTPENWQCVPRKS